MPSVDSLEHADPRAGGADGADSIGGAVGGVVVNEDHFIADAGEGVFEFVEQEGDVVALIEGRDDDCQFQRL
jgi:hypothetical protein